MILVEIAFDFLDQRLLITTSDGQQRVVELGRRPACADFYRDVFGALHAVGVDVEIHAEPFDLGDSPPFAEDTINDSYDADAITRFWHILTRTEHALAKLASRFNGKASPIQLFWHSFDLAHARYSGRPAPVSEGVDPVSAEAYSHVPSGASVVGGAGRRRHPHESGPGPRPSIRPRPDLARPQKPGTCRLAGKRAHRADRERDRTPAQGFRDRFAGARSITLRQARSGASFRMRRWSPPCVRTRRSPLIPHMGSSAVVVWALSPMAGSGPLGDDGSHGYSQSSSRLRG